MADTNDINYSGAISDVASRLGRRTPKPRAGSANPRLAENRSSRASPGSGIEMVAPSTVASYSGARSPIGWTRTAGFAPAGAKFAIALVMFRDPGDSPHTAGIVLRSSPGDHERTVVEADFSYDDEDKQGSVMFFIPLAPDGAFDYKIDGGFTSFKIVVHGYVY